MAQVFQNPYDSFQDLLKASEPCENTPCFQTRNETICYTDFIRMILKVSHALSHRKERIFVIRVQNQVLFSVAYFATILTGHMACILPPSYSLPTFLEDSEVIKDSDIRKWMECPPLVWKQLPTPDCDAPCTIVFTSGTTSAGKGVQLTQRNLLTDTAFAIRHYQYWRDERILHILPYWHIFGLVADLLAPLHRVSTVCVSNSSISFFQDLRHFRPDSVNMPPVVADSLCAALNCTDNPDSVTGGKLRKILCAGAPMPGKTAERLMQYGIAPCVAYGLTECSACISISDDDSVRLDTCGKPLECLDLKFSEDGEILVAGETIMLGYYQDPEATSQRMQDGYFRTGDLGRIDQNGELLIIGRKSSMLVFPNGIKCVPELIERQVNALQDVNECILSQTGTGLSCRPHLVISSLVPQRILREETDQIMKRAELYPYLLTIQTEPLVRNAMGKVVRKS